MSVLFCQHNCTSFVECEIVIKMVYGLVYHIFNSYRPQDINFFYCYTSLLNRNVLILIISELWLQIPDMVLQILWRINSRHAPNFSIVAYDFIIINSSANFIIYVVAADGFRWVNYLHVDARVSQPKRWIPKRSTLMQAKSRFQKSLQR